MVKHFNNQQRLERAQTIALRALAFLLSEPNLLERFLSETGYAPNDIRTNPQATELQEAALTVLLNDEPLLLTFAANAGLSPEDVLQSHDDLTTADGKARPQTSI